MTELRHIGEILVSAQAKNLSADELTEAHQAVQADLKLDFDPESAALQFAWVALVAIERVRHMEESHVCSPDRSAGAGRAEPDVVPVQKSGGGWVGRASAKPSKTTIRPH